MIHGNGKEAGQISFSFFFFLPTHVAAGTRGGVKEEHPLSLPPPSPPSTPHANKSEARRYRRPIVKGGSRVCECDRVLNDRVLGVKDAFFEGHRRQVFIA